MGTNRIALSFGLLLGVASVSLEITACIGPDGPEGPTGIGVTGAQGVAGATGPAGAMGASGTDLDAGFGASIPVSCLSPCHGFNGVVSQFQTSNHYVEYLVNVASLTPETEWTEPGAPCGNCHAIDALAQRVNGAIGTTDDGGVVNLATGELQYRDPKTGVLSSANYIGAALVAEVYCTTCHAVTNANDPHKTGIPWTPGSFPLQVSESAEVNMEKSPSVAAVTGTESKSFGSGNTCMWCHKSRVDITNTLVPTGNAITSVRWGPHEGPQGDLFTGSGGYQYSGNAYGESTHEQKLSCVDCHMISVADNANVPDHSFNPQIAACQSCHAGATSFDINGFQSQIEGALTETETWLNTQGILTRATVAPFVALTGAQLGDGNWSQDQPTPGATIGGALMTQDQAGALYNYLLVARGGASGVHNPKYIAQILFDSYFALAGTPLATFPARPE